MRMVIYWWLVVCGVYKKEKTLPDGFVWEGSWGGNGFFVRVCTFFVYYIPEPRKNTREGKPRYSPLRESQFMP